MNYRERKSVRRLITAAFLTVTGFFLLNVPLILSEIDGNSGMVPSILSLYDVDNTSAFYISLAYRSRQYDLSAFALSYVAATLAFGAACFLAWGLRRFRITMAALAIAFFATCGLSTPEDWALAIRGGERPSGSISKEMKLWRPRTPSGLVGLAMAGNGGASGPSEEAATTPSVAQEEENEGPDVSLLGVPLSLSELDKIEDAIDFLFAKIANGVEILSSFAFWIVIVGLTALSFRRPAFRHASSNP